MIRHRPFGSGHPYSVDTEQRSPVDPIAGEPVILGVRTSSDVAAVSVEIERDGATETLQLSPTTRQSRGQLIDADTRARLVAVQCRYIAFDGGEPRLDIAQGGFHFDVVRAQRAQVFEDEIIGSFSHSRAPKN